MRNRTELESGVRSQKTESKRENRNSNTARWVIPAKAGIYSLIDPRLRGGDVARSEFRVSASF